MADIKISLPSGIVAPTSSDINSAKHYILQRTQAEIALSDAIDIILEKYIGRITRLCWKYNIFPTDFSFAANESLRQQVNALLDDLEEEIFSLIEDSVVPQKRKNNHYAALIAWLLTLGTHNWNFRRTLQYYIFRFSQDVEASIAAMRFAGVREMIAISNMRSTLHSPYALPQVIAAIKSGQFFAADMIRSGGTKTDPVTHQPTVGLSKVGATNITTMARSTLSKVWMRDLFLTAQEQNKAGYFIFRGSSYECPHICDPLVGFHSLDEGMLLPGHSHCRCYAVFVDSQNPNTNDLTNIL